MRFHALAPLAVLVSLTGCHSAFIEATVKNATASPISPFEVDYPSASFGSTVLAPGASFPYRFKILGSGPTKVLWTDLKHVDHTVKGPELQEGEEGTFAVTIRDTDATFLFTPRPRP